MPAGAVTVTDRGLPDVSILPLFRPVQTPSLVDGVAKAVGAAATTRLKASKAVVSAAKSFFMVLGPSGKGVQSPQSAQSGSGEPRSEFG